MKIALVHDYLVQNGGAEKVLQAFCEIFPYAPIYTLVYDKDVMDPFFASKRIYTSRLQNITFARKKHRLFPPLMPSAIEQFDFSAYDVVLSSSHSYAKGVITGPETLHISYMHTPMRYAWDDSQKYINDFYFPRLIKKMVPLAMNSIRVWDKVSAERPDHIIANSNFIARRIKKYYRRDVDTVIHPPLNLERFAPVEQIGDYFLMVGRLMVNKRFDIAIDAFNALGLPLKIIGQGPEMQRLKKRAGPTVEILGWLSDQEVSEYYSRARAFVFPQEEDFGIVAMEAFASGRPVIAYRKGDIVEHVSENDLGVFIEEQTAASVIAAVRTFEGKTFDQERIRAFATQFDKAIFKSRIENYVEQAVQKHLEHSVQR